MEAMITAPRMRKVPRPSTSKWSISPMFYYRLVVASGERDYGREEGEIGLVSELTQIYPQYMFPIKKSLPLSRIWK